MEDSELVWKLKRMGFFEDGGALSFSAGRNYAKVDISNRTYTVAGSEDFVSQAEHRLSSLGLQRVAGAERDVVGEVLKRNDFTYNEKVGYVKKFKTHLVIYKDGEVVFYFPHREDVGDNDARVERWKDRFKAMNVPVEKFSLVVGGE